MKVVAEPHHLRCVRVRTRPDAEGNVQEVQIPKVSPDLGLLHELGGSQEQHSEAAMPLAHTKTYLDGIEDTKFYTLGCKDLSVVTDHSPLVKSLGDKFLADKENPRL